VSTITVPLAVLQQALEALEDYERHTGFRSTATDSLRAALAQQEQEQEHEQEPVAWGLQNDEGQVFDCIAPGSRIELSEYNVPLFTHPPRREWQSLTEGEMHGLYRRAGLEAYYPRDGVVQYEYERRLDEYARAIEAALKERNT
jgi:hypothetical protein